MDADKAALVIQMYRDGHAIRYICRISGLSRLEVEMILQEYMLPK